MAQRLKRWESPRREGRNDKGRGGSARQRQKQKQMKALRQRLKDKPDGDRSHPKQSKNSKGENSILSLFYAMSGDAGKITGYSIHARFWASF